MISERLNALLKDPKLLPRFLIRKRMLANFLALDKDFISKYLKEANEITNIMSKWVQNLDVSTHKIGAMLSPLRGPIVFVCIRALKPQTMIETGVASGASTCYILKAMELNNKGQLYSIDLPGVDSGALIPQGKQVGWLVPEELKHRWQLIIGRSQEKLFPLLTQLRTLDAFLHDSEHTYQTMMFEYETVWPFLRKGSLLLSDDVKWNKAFHNFVQSRKPKRWTTFDGLGAIIK